MKKNYSKNKAEKNKGEIKKYSWKLTKTIILGTLKSFLYLGKLSWAIGKSVGNKAIKSNNNKPNNSKLNSQKNTEAKKAEVSFANKSSNSTSAKELQREYSSKNNKNLQNSPKNTRRKLSIG